MSNKPPFHQGELKVQQMANESAIGQRNGGVITDTIIRGAIPFIAQQNMLVTSSLDKAGNVWASVLIGTQSFIHAPNEREIRIDRDKIVSHGNDPFWQNIAHEPQVGLLAIELNTRRRFRVNGRISRIDDSTYQMTVKQAYPNCPKYIQRRSLSLDQQLSSQPLGPVISGSQLSAKQHALINRADSLFVASASPIETESGLANTELSAHGADASYRGGFPGFIEVKGQTLRIPDYKGNSMFNTLGNIEIYPRAGIAIIDFENHQILHLSGTAKVLWNQHDPTGQSAGTKRFWELDVTHWQETPIPHSVNWQFFDYSPHNPRETKPVNSESESLSLMVKMIEQKSPKIKRFRLVSTDATELPAFQPGAHLPIEVLLPNGNTELRHYSLLNAPGENRFYDIAVQREEQGRGGSLTIHQALKTGMVIKAKPPRNEFPLAKAEHTLLVAGGIGITPILSMLRALEAQNASYEIHYTTRDKTSMAFYHEVKQLAGNKAHFYFSGGPQSKKLDLYRLIKSSKNNAHLYICGPVSMITAARDAGQLAGWNDAQIHFESFGAHASAKDKPIQVKLAKTGGVVTVKPTQSILDALTQANISVPYDCKRGECGMCATGLLAGEADHRDVYLTKEEANNQICVCVSRAKTDSIELDL